MHQLRKPHWTERFQRSPYFIGAILFHLVIGAFLTLYIVIPAPSTRPDDLVVFIIPPIQDKDDLQQLVDPNPNEDPIEGSGGLTEPVHIPTPTSGGATSPLDFTIHLQTPSDFGISIAKGELQPGDVGAMLEQVNGENMKRSSQILEGTNQKRRDFYQKWYESSGTSSNRVATFTVYVAKVEGLNAQKLLKSECGREEGPLQNLMKVSEEWSRQTMKPRVSAEPLNLADEALIDKAPPFIFFSGSCDFKLTEKEVLNLQRYLSVGGAVWADNALAGNRSRFDIAFRREMKRVVGQLEFEVLPLEHPVFQGPKALIQITSVPEGMIYRKDPIEVIKIDGEIAVIYTPNNYTDMMRMVFQSPLKFKGNEALVFDLHGDFNREIPSTPLMMWKNRKIYFRNFEPESAEQVFKMGVNLIFHLISRWQDRLEQI